MHSNIIPIENLDLPELAPYRTLRRPSSHVAQGIFVAEGEKVVRRLLDSRLAVISLLVSPNWLERVKATHPDRIEDLAIYVAGESFLREIVGYNIHEGVMAIGRMPRGASLEGIAGNHLIVALDGLRSAENVGVIVRTCAAFGVDMLISGERSCSPWVRRAVRNSMGAVFRLPILETEDLVSTLGDLRSRFQTRILACDPHGEEGIYDCSFEGDVCLIFGNEDTGISREISAMGTDSVAIPMSNDTDSLNVASAAAAFLCEAARRRK
jgi:tRNA G18 (ribose-2'-O)-methylase SpoU